MSSPGLPPQTQMQPKPGATANGLQQMVPATATTPIALSTAPQIHMQAVPINTTTSMPSQQSMPTATRIHPTTAPTTLASIRMQAPGSTPTHAPGITSIQRLTHPPPTGTMSTPPIPGQQRPAEYLVLIPRQGPSIRYPFIPIQRHQMIRGVVQPGIGVHPSTVIPTSQPMATMAGSPIIQHANLINSSAASAPSQMTPNDALTKGTSFFNTLLTKESIKSKKETMQNLIQSLINGTKTPSEFATTLQRELNSGPQVQLVPFLEILLPSLRKSMIEGHTKLPGITAPPVGVNSPVKGLVQVLQPQTDDPSTSSSTRSPASNSSQKKKKVPLPFGQKSAYAMKKEAREARKKERESLAAAASGATGEIKREKTEEKKEPEKSDKSEKAPKTKPDKPRNQNRQKKQEKQLESLSATLRDDDDVNDVAAMGGVNLAEESHKIMASGAELVGTQIRSCKDEAFFDINVLSAKIARITKENNLGEPSQDVVTLISHATQERLKDLVERLGILAEHRSENLKLNPKYEVSNDIKGQMKFLAELDRIEKRRYEEQERELLLRVAKSRSKVEDPEQIKLRQKAKDMQRAEQEEVRQREANETALLAIGPRKKLKSSAPSSISMFSQSSSFGDLKMNVDIRQDHFRRSKRVNIRDLQVLLELERIHLNRLVKITAQ